MVTTSPAPTAVVPLVCVESLPLAGHGVAYLARRYPDLRLLGSAASVAEARSLIAGTDPAVVTVSDALPGGGADLVAELRGRYPELGLVVVSHHTGDDELSPVRDAGASAFVSRTAPVTALVAALRHARAEPGRFRTFGVRRPVLPAGRTAAAAGGTAATALSARERQVLALLREGHSHEQAATALGIREGTVRTHVARLFAKLRVSNRSQALVATFSDEPTGGPAAAPRQPHRRTTPAGAAPAGARATG